MLLWFGVVNAKCSCIFARISEWDGKGEEVEVRGRRDDGVWVDGKVGLGGGISLAGVGVIWGD